MPHAMVARSSTAIPMSVAEVNAARNRLGLHSLIHDPLLSQWAASNNAEQARRGKLGHHVNNGYGQCAGVGISGAHSALAMWAGSPAHAAIIFAPDLVAVGYHESGGCCTVATSQGGEVQTQALHVVYPTIRYYPARRGWRLRIAPRCH